MLFACLMINQNGFYSLEIRRTHLKGQRETEIAVVVIAQGSLRALSAKPLLTQVHETEGGFMTRLPSLHN